MACDLTEHMPRDITNTPPDLVEYFARVVPKMVHLAKYFGTKSPRQTWYGNLAGHYTEFH